MLCRNEGEKTGWIIALGIKTAISGVKNKPDRLDTAKEKVGELENTAIETIQRRTRWVGRRRVQKQRGNSQ